MCRSGKLRWLGVSLLLLAGCRSSDVDLKPTKTPEEFVRPPDEARFGQPLEYPKNTLFTDVIQKDTTGATTPNKGPGGFSGGPGMGRPGY
jgi:hypothetical protein